MGWQELVPGARLGTAIHRLLAGALDGSIANSGQSIEHAWNAIVIEVEVQMSRSELERYLVPLSRSVNDYEVQKLRAFNRAHQLLQSAANVKWEPVRMPGLGCEVKVQSRDGAVGGFIDLVYETQIGRVIRDYKSGSLWESDPSQPPGINSEYLAQVKLYAALYYETFSVWPVRLELMPLQGDAVEIAVDTAECKRLLQNAQVTFNSVNRSIAHARLDQCLLRW